MFFCINIFAANKKLGLGIILGDSVGTGISAKLWTGSRTAIDGAVGWEEDVFRIQADYLSHDFNLINVKKGELPVYYGIGGRFNFQNNYDTIFGIRIPVGINYIFANVPFDIFFELVPIFDLEPKTEVHLHAGIGIRYFFE